MSDTYDTTLEGLLPPPTTSLDGMKSRVILSATDEQKFSYDRVVDARTAMARGLKEYLEQLSLEWEGRDALRFKRVLQTWADPETPEDYPSCAVVGSVPMEYEDATMTPVLHELEDGTRRFLRFPCECKQAFTVTAWGTDEIEREGLVAMLEDAFEPASFMTGLRIEVPYYFNARVTYEKLRMYYEDSEEDARRGWRKAIFTVNAHVPQIRPVGKIPLMDARVRTGVGLTEVTTPKRFGRHSR